MMSTISVLIMLMAIAASCGDNQQWNPETKVVERSSDALWGYSYFPSIYFPNVNTIFAAMLGRELNGTTLNGKVLDNHWVVGVSLEDVELPNGKIQTLALTATRFRSLPTSSASFFGHSQGRLLRNRQLEGALFMGVLDDGDTISLRIDDVVRSWSGTTFGLSFYEISYPTDEAWQPMCGVDEDGEPILAIPLNDLWNYQEGVTGGGSRIENDDAFTFACVGHVLEKCVEMGYRPWLPGLMCSTDENEMNSCDWISLADHHQTCTRVLRADYCGDGISHTIDGTMISVYDNIGIRWDGQDWPFEAEWTPEGARCVKQERIEELEETPECLSDLLLEDCGNRSHFETGTLLMSEDMPTEDI